MIFDAVVELHGKTATGISVPEEVVAQLGSSQRPAVHVTINGFSYRSTVARMRGQFLLPLSAENRAGAGVTAGDAVQVSLELDDQPREIDVPADLAAALAGDPVARAFFESLSYSNKRWHVTQIEGAKAESTRQRRVLKSLEVLRAGQKP